MCRCILYIAGTLPSSIGNLEHLQQLYVDFNNLNGTLPDSLSKLTNLASLSLQSNHFEGSIPPSLGKLLKLKSLYLDHNRLTGSIPSTLGSLPLNDLTGSNNLLTGTLPATLADIARKGRVVDFSYNDLHGEIPVELCLARNLFLIANNITNNCKEICHDKRYRVSIF
jgi:Leucine-rich repeat (LRR) protein